MKIVTELVAKGFVNGARGKGGGLRLARAASEIGLGDVVRQLEPSLALVECFGTRSHCVLDPACRLKGALDSALQAFLAALDRVSLADLVGTDARLHAVLGLPAGAQAPRPTIVIRPAPPVASGDSRGALHHRMTVGLRVRWRAEPRAGFCARCSQRIRRGRGRLGHANLCHVVI